MGRQTGVGWSIMMPKPHGHPFLSFADIEGKEEPRKGKEFEAIDGKNRGG